MTLLRHLVHKWTHRAALFVRPLKAGIFNPRAFNLWFLTSPSSHPQSKTEDLHQLRNELIAFSDAKNNSTKRQNRFYWQAHPLVELSFRRIKLFGLKFIFVSSISSPFFDSDFYTHKNPDVRRHNENPLSHYVLFGFFALLQPSDGVFNSRPETDWAQRDHSYAEKRDYLWTASQERKLLVPTDVEQLRKEASTLITLSDSAVSDNTETTPSNLKVSVIIPCFEQARFLEECLLSVAQAITEPHECIIIDDGNTRAEDLKILQSLSPAEPHQRVIIHRQDNQGIAGARNAGLGLARGQFIKFLDSDDLLVNGSLDVQLAEMERAQSFADVGGYQVVSDNMEVIAESIGPISELPQTSTRQIDVNVLVSSWEQGVALPIHSLLIRRDQVDVTNVALRSKEDFRMWLELGANKSTFSTSPGVVALYRQHDKQMTSGSRARHGLYFLEALYDFDQKHTGLLKRVVLQAKLDYINDFYGSAPEKIWRDLSPVRSQWLSDLGR